MVEKPKPGPLQHPQAEDDEINAAIAADPDTWEPTDADWARARPAAELYPELKNGAGAKPQFAPEVIERLKKTEPEKARRLEALNRETENRESRVSARTN
ncbi:MAG: hypothetical protein ACYYKD_03445 [Rhodospirillales bacterium]